MSDPDPTQPTPDPDAQPDTAAGEGRADTLLVPPTRQAQRGGLSDGQYDTGPASHTPASLRHVDWGEVFPFVHLFKGFRLAVHPPKLMLALVAVLLIYGGGRVLDGIWGLLPDRYQPVPGEVQRFDGLQAAGGVLDLDRLLAGDTGVPTASVDDMRRAVALKNGVALPEVDSDDLYDYVAAERDEKLSAADAAYEAAKARDGGATDADRERLERDRALAYRTASRDARRIDDATGGGLFETLYSYQAAQVTGATAAVLALDFNGPRGILASVYRFVWVGPQWAFSQHTVYFTLLFLWALIVLSIFGGALVRITAVQVARDETLALRSALRFSAGKFVSFLSAPLIPLLVIGLVVLSIAMVVLVLSLIGLIPGMGWVTEIGVALLLPLALLGGFLMALAFVGLVGGISLMYPTIAAEGTDSFDAISRSFGFLFSCPWRLAFYAVVGLAYGAITFLFVRLLVWLVLVLTHAAASLFLLQDAAGVNLLDAMWPAPASPGSLSYDVAYINLTLGQKIGAAIISFWVYGLISLLVAYALSLYLSLSTIIYFLMRREVDATEMEDVYIDPADEEYDGYADVPEDPHADPLDPKPTEA